MRNSSARFICKYDRWTRSCPDPYGSNIRLRRLAMLRAWAEAFAGASKRSSALRTYHRAEIEDKVKLIEALQNHPEVHETVQKIANAAVERSPCRAAELSKIGGLNEPRPNSAFSQSDAKQAGLWGKPVPGAGLPGANAPLEGTSPARTMRG
jgi:hypothetical protein